MSQSPLSVVPPAVNGLEDVVLRVLTIAASRNEAEQMFALLRKAGFGVRSLELEDPRELPGTVLDEWDLIIHCQSRGLGSSFDALGHFAQSGADAPFLVLVDRYSDVVACRLLNAGASRVINRDQPELLLAVIEAELASLGHRRAARRFERLYRDTERRCTSLLASSTDAVAYVAEGMHVFANSTYVALFGYRHPRDLDDLPVLDLVGSRDEATLREFLRQLPDAQGVQVIDIACNRASGRPFRARLSFSDATYDGEPCYQILARDLSERDALEAQLERLRSHDRLTGLLNHQHFLNVLARRTNRLAGSTELYLALVEIENFRDIRKQLGISASDDIVREIAATFTEPLGGDEVTARIGDHTFAILSSQADRSANEATLEAVRMAVEAHICTAGGQSIAATCSIGAVRVQHGESAAAALAKADEACREAVLQGGNRVVLAKSRAKEPPASSALEKDIPRILETNRLALVFQPIVSLHGRSQECYEVLLRVYDEQGALLPTPAVFAAAARVNMATALDSWVIEHSVECADRLRAKDQRVRFFIKLSEHAIQDEAVFVRLTKVAQRMAIDPDQLVFQFSAHVAGRQLKLVRTAVNLLKGLHFPTAIEHFGLGTRPFGTLTHLDVDYLKLDSSLLDGLTDDSQSEQALRILQESANRRNKETIATSVQDSSSLAILWKCGIHLAQGYYIQEPAAELSYEFVLGTD